MCSRWPSGAAALAARCAPVAPRRAVAAAPHGVLAAAPGLRLRPGAGRGWRGVGSVPLPEVLAASEVAAGERSSSGGSSSSAVPNATGVLWFANIYPTKVNRFDLRGALTHHNHEVLIPKLLPSGVEILRMVPREREGGAFVYFRAPPSFVLQVLLSGKDAQAKDKRFVSKGDVDILAKVSDGICHYLKNHSVRAFLVPLPVRAYRVRGDPYLEELQSRFPSSRLRIRMDPPGSLPEEELYPHLRKYGILLDIHQLEDKKGYSASFQYIAAAVAARNCLHRARLNSGSGEEEVRLHIEYEPYMRKWMREAITSNARYSVPLMVFMLLGATYLVCDPIRSYSVQFRIARLLAEESLMAGSHNQEDGEEKPACKVSPTSFWAATVRLLMYWRSASNSIDRASASVGLGQKANWRDTLLSDFWAERDKEVADLRSWLADPKDQVMLLTGRRGNGQSSFVRDTCGVNGIYLNVAHMLEAGGSFDDRIFVKQFSKAFAYWPTQGMDRQMNALLDLILPGSSKLSRENEALVMVQRVLSTVTAALGAWHHRRLGCHDWESLPSSGVPLIVIDGFTSENKGRRGAFFESLVTWAAYVSEEHLARVLFIADSSFAEPAILSALGNRPERLEVRELHDAKPGALVPILERHFGKEHRVCRLTEEEVICIGGRFRDICALAEQVHRGTSAADAVRRLTEGAETTVRNLLMRGQEGAKWTRPQLWRAVKLLSQATQEQGVPYDVFLFEVFRGDEAGLQSMKESNLVAVAPRELYADGASSSTSRPARRTQHYKVLPGSPLFAEAYRRLSSHPGLKAVLDLEVSKEDIKREQGVLEGYEAELAKLQEIDDVYHHKGRRIADPNESLRTRKVQLLDLIREQNVKLENAHKARREAVKTLKQRKESWTTAIQREAQPEPRAVRGGETRYPWLRSLAALLGLA